jgi:hypothetical protein
MNRIAKADMTPVRQRTQYTCVPASLAMCLRALGHDVTEDIVNKVMGAAPMKGARWEEVLAAAQHFGCRATLTMPSTVEQLKAWTDAGTPVMIAWNPEGRPWSHASAVFDVEEREDGLYVHVADPNMPNPKKTVRVVAEDDFYGKWYEKTADYLVRRPAVAIEREITAEGHQVNILSGEEAMPSATKLLASRTASQADPADRLADRWVEARAKRKNKPLSQKDRMKVDKTPDKLRSAPAKALAERGNAGAGKHKNKQDFDRGQSRKPKHKKDWTEREAATEYNFDVRGVVQAVLAYMEDTIPGYEPTVTEGEWQGTPEIRFTYTDRNTPMLRGPAASKANRKFKALRKRLSRFGLTAIDYDEALYKDTSGGYVQLSIGGYGSANGTPLRVAASANWRDWVRQTPGAEDPDGPVTMALGELLQVVQNEGLEAVHPKDALEMLAWDWGWSGQSLPRDRRHFANVLAKPLRVNLRKHHQDGLKAGSEDRVASRYAASKPYSGNPDGKPIYPNAVDHGDTGEPLAGGTDIMRRVQNKLLEEQGNPKRPRSPEASLRLSADRGTGADRIAAAWLGESE